MRPLMSFSISFALLGLVGCQSTTGKTAHQSMSDAGITASVQSKLTADRMANFSRIDVDTERGVVTLTGVVPTVQDKERAARVVREVEGVKRLNNNLQVQDQMPR